MLADDAQPRRTYVLDINTVSGFNFGHLLFEDILPVVAAADVFDVPLSEVRLLHTGYAAETDEAREYAEWGGGVTRHRLCIANYALYSKLVLGEAAVDVSTDASWCSSQPMRFMRRLIVGQSAAFSLRTLDLQRGATVRRAVVAMRAHVGLPPLLPPVAAEQPLHVLALLNGRGLYPPFYLRLCDAVRRAARDVSDTVECAALFELSVVRQMELAKSASVIVAEHSTTLVPFTHARAPHSSPSARAAY